MVAVIKIGTIHGNKVTYSSVQSSTVPYMSVQLRIVQFNAALHRTITALHKKHYPKLFSRLVVWENLCVGFRKYIYMDIPTPLTATANYLRLNNKTTAQQDAYLLCRLS